MTENELLAELIKLNYIEPVDPETEVTHAMLAQSLGISERQATTILQGEVKAGRLTVREARAQSGFKVKAYRKA
jgi:predicted transcriptional regulator